MSFLQAASPIWTSRMLSVLRIIAGLLIMWSGTSKLFGYPPGPNPSVQPIVLTSQRGVAGILETAGGLAVLLGLGTRPAAFVLSGEMAVAYFQVHFARGFFPNSNGGHPAALFCFIFLYLAFAGGGPWSLDAVIARSKSTPPMR